MNFDKALSDKKKKVEEHLYTYFSDFTGLQQTVFQAADYSLKAGGKRLRPVLLLEACRLFDGDEGMAMPFACAMEMIHTYSLIHDDLPAMDDDDFRRGKPTNHVVYGEGMAILAGDALLNYAYELMIKETMKAGSGTDTCLSAMNEIAQAAGVYGMIGGQVVDLESEQKQVPIETVDFIHGHKTGAMISASLMAGAMLGGANETDLAVIRHYGRNIGMAFQIIDDILDIVGDQEKLGKDIGSDAEKQKSTYPSLLGLEESRRIAHDLLRESKEILDGYGQRAEFLKALSDFLANREF